MKFYEICKDYLLALCFIKMATIVSFVLYHQRRFIGTCETNDQKFMPLQYIVVNMVMQLGQTFWEIAFELFTFFKICCSIKSLDIAHKITVVQGVRGHFFLIWL